MSLLFILLDTVVKFGFVILFGFFIRSLVRGDFRLNPNHQYAEVESDIHIYLIYKFNDEEAPDEVVVLCDAHAKTELPKYRNVTDIEKHEVAPDLYCTICGKP
jgi:hypothetical protein